jgi:hypothetical protein
LGLLSRRKNGLTAELESLQHRKSQLTALLSAAEQRLAEHIQDRQRRLLESDLADGQPVEALVVRFADERDAVVAALTTIDSKIMDAQACVDRERDRIRRETGSKELAAAVEGLTRVHDELAAVAAKVAPAIAAVLAKLPPPHLVAPERVKAFADGVIEALQVVVHEGQSHAARLISGDAQVVRAIAEPVKPPAPAIERREVFVLQPSCWRENGEVFTAGAHCTVSPPVEIAKLAIQHGHAIEAGTPLAVTLQMRQPPSYANYAPADCLDIGQPKPVIKPVGTPTAALPAIHSEFNRGRGGFATVLRNAR